MSDVSNRSRDGSGKFATEALTAADLAAVDLPDASGDAVDEAYAAAIDEARAARRRLGPDDEGTFDWLHLEEGDHRVLDVHSARELFRETGGRLGTAVALRVRDESDARGGLSMRVTAAEGIRDLELHEVARSQGAHTFYPDGTRVAAADQDEEDGERIRRTGVTVGRQHGIPYDTQLVRLDDGTVASYHPYAVEPDSYTEWTSGAHNPNRARTATRNGHRLSIEPMPPAHPSGSDPDPHTHYWAIELGPASSASGSARSEAEAIRQAEEFSDGMAAAQVRNARERAAQAKAFAAEARA